MRNSSVLENDLINTMCRKVEIENTLRSNIHKLILCELSCITDRKIFPWGLDFGKVNLEKNPTKRCSGIDLIFQAFVADCVVSEISMHTLSAGLFVSGSV